MTEQEKREKVINGLECCLGKGQKRGMCEDCPYDTNTGRIKCNLGDMHVDALALLKTQEQVEPKEVIYDDVHRSVYCPNCDNRLAGLTYSGAVALEIEETPNYCWMCGQAVKW